MTRVDIIDTVSEECELTKRQTGEILDVVLDTITGALRSGDEVRLTSFGSFKIRSRKKRSGRNPRTGDAVMIPARRVPAFVAGKALREAVGGAQKTPVISKAHTVSMNGRKKVAGPASKAKTARR